MSLFQVTKKQVIENYELRTITGDIVSFTPSYSQLLPDPFSDLNVTVNVLATGGNGTPDNPNPIVGYTEANITRCGKNIFDYDLSDATNLVKYVQVKTGNGTFTMSSNVPLVEGASVLFFLGGYQTSGGSTAENGVSNGIPRTVTTNDGYVTFAYRYYGTPTVTPADYDIQLEEGSTATSYHAYNGTTHVISFGQTVYGGVLDVTRGKLTVTHGYDDMGTLDWYYTSDNYFYADISDIKPNPSWGATSDVLCSCFVATNPNAIALQQSDYTIAIWPTGHRIVVRDTDYSDKNTFTSAMSGVTVVYPIATPFDIDLTPEVISAIVGTNNVFAGCGETTVTCLI